MCEPIFADLIDRVRRGDALAFETLLETYGEAIRREIRFSLLDSRLRRVVGDSDIFQSVVTQLFVGLWNGRYEFDGPAQFSGLLKDITRKRVADKARYWHSQRRDMRRNQDESAAAGVDGSPRLTPSRIVANSELLESVRQRMNETELRILDWRQQRLGWPEIASLLGETASPEAIRKRYERALARISHELGIEFG